VKPRYYRFGFETRISPTRLKRMAACNKGVNATNQTQTFLLQMQAECYSSLLERIGMVFWSYWAQKGNGLLVILIDILNGYLHSD